MSTPEANTRKKMNPPGAPDKLTRLKKRDYMIGDSDDFVHMDWSSEWSELKNLEWLTDGQGSESTSESD